eukprot:scaffold132786_cov22-Cyclotella_meneghiniana.AAC.1
MALDLASADSLEARSSASVTSHFSNPEVKASSGATQANAPQTGVANGGPPPPRTGKHIGTHILDAPRHQRRADLPSRPEGEVSIGNGRPGLGRQFVVMAVDAKA